MKRNMDLVRKLLVVMEEMTDDTERVKVEGFDKDTISHHLKIMGDAHLVEGVKDTTGGTICKRLTWDGHEFLDMCRKDTLWEKAKLQVTEKAGGLSFFALKTALTELLKSQLG